MITAKLIKIQERLNARSSRVRDKDAVDILRLLVASETEHLVSGFRKHDSGPAAAAATARALDFLTEQHARGRRSDMARLIHQGTGGDATALAQFEELGNDLLAAL